ncbi:MAG TPA: TRAP transporter small permease subunit [Burkholderiales bacterium]|nr:TRAP transporter small permease subunit [Burkholderiales bacterium]
MLLATMTLADGTLRWLANRPIEGVRDVGAAVIAVAVSCCFPAGLIERTHITIRVAGSIFGTRFGSVLDALAAIAVWVVTIAMAWQFTVFAGKIAHAGETTWVLKIPTAPFWYTVAAILWIAAFVQMIVVLLQISKAR